MRRILLMLKNESLLTVLSFALESEGFLIRVAGRTSDEDGPGWPELVVVDLDDEDTARRLRELGYAGRVLVLTNFVARTRRGREGDLETPLRLKEFTALVRGALGEDLATP